VESSGVTNPPIGAQLVYPDYVSGVLCAIIIISGALPRPAKEGRVHRPAQSEATAFAIGANLMEAASMAEPRAHRQYFASVAPHGCYPCKGDGA
jgi:crotonobetainyl-CoA:carnitine CoA-transferase CaiB-like acyl-CoA transferase